MWHKKYNNDNDSITNGDIWHAIPFYYQTFIKKLCASHCECANDFDIDKSNRWNK